MIVSEELQNSISNVTQFIDKANRYTDIKELSAELLNLFIEKIEVGERAERYSRTAEQEIVIHYRDIGGVGAFAEESEKILEQQQKADSLICCLPRQTTTVHIMSLWDGTFVSRFFFFAVVPSLFTSNSR